MANVYLYIGTSGLSLYGRIEKSTGVFIAFALTEGTGGALGKYYVTEAALVSAGLTSAGTYVVTVHSGATPSTSATDLIVSYDDNFGWSGTSYIPPGSSGGSSNVSAELVDNEHTFRFSRPDQLVADNIVREIIDFNGILAMDFEGAMHEADTLISAVIDIMVPDTGITISSPTDLPIHTDGKKVHLSTIASTAGTYIIVVKATSNTSLAIPRRGILEIESKTGT